MFEVYRREGSIDKALAMSEKCSAFFKRANNDEGLALLLENTALLHAYSLKNTERALELLDAALQKKTRFFGEGHVNTAHTMELLAPLLQHHGRFEEAEQMFTKCIETRRKVCPHAFDLCTSSCARTHVCIIHTLLCIWVGT